MCAFISLHRLNLLLDLRLLRLDGLQLCQSLVQCGLKSFHLLDLLRRCASALFGKLRMHHVLFLAFTIIAAVPVFTLAWWVEHRAVQQEINGATDKHLLVARNLTAAFSRYVFDLKAGFDLAISTFNSGEQAEGLKSLLRRVVGKIFSFEVKGWCSEFEARNAAGGAPRAHAAP